MCLEKKQRKPWFLNPPRRNFQTTMKYKRTNGKWNINSLKIENYSRRVPRCPRPCSSSAARGRVRTSGPPASRTWRRSRWACRTCMAWWRWGQVHWRTGRRPLQSRFWNLENVYYTGYKPDSFSNLVVVTSAFLLLYSIEIPIQNQKSIENMLVFLVSVIF